METDEHLEVHRQHEQELENLNTMQREDLRHDCGASAFDNYIGRIMEDAAVSLFVWLLQHTTLEVAEDLLDHAWRRAREGA